MSIPLHSTAVLVVAAALSQSAAAGSPAWLTARDGEIRELVGRMTLAEKVGQMTQPDCGSVRDLGDIGRLCLGSMLSGGSSDPPAGNTAADWAGFYQECQARARGTRLGIPLLYGVDAVHGHNNVLGAVVFPHNIGLGCTRDARLVEEVARATAVEVRATGIQWAFAPCVAVPRDIRWGRTYEGFAEDPAVVAELGAAAVRGLQGERLAGPAAVVACAKHYVGDGGTTFGTSGAGGLLDQGDTRLGEAELRAVHMAGYPAAVDAGVGTIMPSYNCWNGVKCSASHHLLTEVLKGQLGFDGFLISDYNAIDQLAAAQPDAAATGGNHAAGQVRTANYKRCLEIAIHAGMDMAMVTDRYPEFITLLQELVTEGKVPLARIDDAVTRILRVKFALGMMEPGADLGPVEECRRQFGSAAHRALARRAVAGSLVLLKHRGGVLPLKPSARRIHVAGRGADDLGMQCGGWTIDWQGKRGAVTPGGTTILAAIRAAAGPQAEVTHAADGSGAAGADVAVVVIGEEPYAEMKGDRADLALDKEDRAAVAAARQAGVPVVVVLLSGRPLILGGVLDQADAVVAAWLPGTEGGGVAAGLFGATPFTGRLSFTWPRSMDEVPLAKAAEPLFAAGFGLRL